jgi:glycosyltransferase involved in cell wall biosynthesis
MPRVSVIIPTYNRAALLPRAIDSVLAQTYQDFDIVIVDDGSTDGTRAVVEAYGDPRIRYLGLSKRRGVSAARNAGIAQAAGEWIAFIDSDDEWLPEKLERQLALADADPSLDIIQCWHIRDVNGVRTVALPANPQGKAGFELVLHGWRQCSVIALIVRRSALDAVGGFDEKIPHGEDWDLQYRLDRAGFRYGVVSDALLIYYLGHEQLTQDVVSRQWAFRMLRKRWGHVFRERLGPEEYKAWRKEMWRNVRGGHKAYVNACIARGDRRAAWRYTMQMLPYFWEFRRFTTRALLFALSGRRTQI